ncbi:hypothetical protein QLQ15_03175 [Lysobacter sp. LF1]|uniref:Uncharacterized protein n=1 Tax=Lysobacter stagni TaxID=3045172 RepID=A0ABT6XCP2_9GAMM|nr:hypothetical protein [Lysobacter sp. LF1]MDI9237907.1 hypothetical protein [Lysobacter sp. LF1]
MRYASGEVPRLGDRVAIDARYRGTVVACIGRDHPPEYPAAEWAYLERGLLIDTDFAGLVHYPDPEHEPITLIARATPRVV